MDSNSKWLEEWIEHDRACKVDPCEDIKDSGDNKRRTITKSSEWEVLE